jgi:hypothetical protein
MGLLGLMKPIKKIHIRLGLAWASPLRHKRLRGLSVYNSIAILSVRLLTLCDLWMTVRDHIKNISHIM